MTQEEKQLLLKDLCARLPYGLIIEDLCCNPSEAIELSKYCMCEEVTIPELILTYADNIKPYLRPLSSMTEEEEDDLRVLKNCLVECNEDDDEKFYGIIDDIHNFYYSRHIDCSSLIDRGLALEAKEGMYNV